MVLFYFSGTGNSKYIADLFSEKMQCLNISVEKENEFDIHSMIYENAEIGFCFPIYGSCPPKIMRAFVTKYREALQGKKLILLCTQAMGSGDGARSLLEELEGISYEVIYAEHFFMPNNICNIPFPVLPKKWYPKLAQHKVDKIYKNLNRKKYKRRGFHPISILVGKGQRIVFKKAEKNYAGSVRIKDSCNGCRQCVSHCPMDNFYVENGKIKVKEQCMICYRCINLCPQKAITVWIDRPVKKQYKWLNFLTGEKII